jgi:hypothetical protein
MVLTDKYLIYGTMLGMLVLYDIDKDREILLSKVQEEHIVGLKIKDNQLYVCIGDYKILIYNLTPGITENSSNYDEIINYEEDEHSIYCDKCLTMLNNNYLLRFFLDWPEKDEDYIQKNQNTQIIIQNIYEKEPDKIEDNIIMSNYSVPFDFDGKNLIYIDFITETSRRFKIYDVEAKKTIQDFEIESFKNKIGHISHLNILKNEKIFLVRDYNICEIRDFNFELQNTLNINSNEILAYDFMFDSEDEQNNEEHLSKIVFLDIDCNIFLYDYKEDKSELLVNLEKDELNIDKEILEQKFFLFGYPYYIKISKKYISISFDYGCILLKYNK